LRRCFRVAAPAVQLCMAGIRAGDIVGAAGAHRCARFLRPPGRRLFAHVFRARAVGLAGACSCAAAHLRAAPATAAAMRAFAKARAREVLLANREIRIMNALLAVARASVAEISRVARSAVGSSLVRRTLRALLCAGACVAVGRGVGHSTRIRLAPWLVRPPVALLAPGGAIPLRLAACAAIGSYLPAAAGARLQLRHWAALVTRAPAR
jgi:hypothetical protein